MINSRRVIDELHIYEKKVLKGLGISRISKQHLKKLLNLKKWI